jgi:hypothetical protein
MDFPKRIILKDYFQLSQKGFLFVLFLISASLFFTFLIDLYNKVSVEDNLLLGVFISFTISTLLIIIAFLKVGFLVDRNKNLFKGFFFNEKAILVFKLKGNITNTFSISERKVVKFNTSQNYGSKEVVFDFLIYKFSINGKKLILVDSKKDKDQLKMFLESNTHLKQDNN